jgi:hypothetical protein
MLSSKPNRDEWIKKYAINTNSISPDVFQTPIPDSSSVKKKHSVVVPFLYQIVFDTIQNIPVSTKILSEASKNNLKIDCDISISLFDLEGGTFFGKTWHSPEPIPLINKLDDESDSDEDKSDSELIDKQRAQLIGNKLSVHLKNQV